METQVILWILGAMITLVSGVVATMAVAIWFLVRLVWDIQVKLAGDHPNADKIKEMMETAVKPILDQNKSTLGRIISIESALLNKGVVINHGRHQQNPGNT